MVDLYHIRWNNIISDTNVKNNIRNKMCWIIERV